MKKKFLMGLLAACLLLSSCGRGMENHSSSEEAGESSTYELSDGGELTAELEDDQGTGGL